MTLSPISVYTIPTTVLILIGLWLVYATSKKNPPGNAKPAMTLFKASTIITLVVVCMGVVLMLIACLLLIIMPRINFGFGTDEIASFVLTTVGLVFLAAVALIVIFFVFYFRSLMKVFSGIRRGLTDDAVRPLKGVTFQVVLAYIGIVFLLLGILATAAVLLIDRSVMNVAIENMPREYQSMLGSFRNTLTNPLLYLITIAPGLVTQVGAIMCLTLLSRFNKSLKRDRTGY